ncbi:MAG: cyclodeaminase/cyclohydrolase family protein, partial [Candidatus Riflebacteria bacterium]|nr:cyclodeaminase/cyclohydrolase family protein [Candidatus Riflebacteria bacterium]
GAYQNVLINMKDIKDEKFKSETLQEADSMRLRAETYCKEILSILDELSK